MFLLKSNQTCFILVIRKGCLYKPDGRTTPTIMYLYGKVLANYATLQRAELGSLFGWDGGNEHAYDCLHA